MPFLIFWFCGDFLYPQGIRERAKRATANRKPQHAHLMDNLAPHTKRLAETAIGGPPVAANQQPQQQQQRVTTTTPASISGTGNSVGGSGGNGNGSGGGALAGSLLSSAPGVTLAKTTLLGRTASVTMNKQQNRRRSLFDEDKVTDQGSGSQVSHVHPSYIVSPLCPASERKRENKTKSSQSGQ